METLPRPAKFAPAGCQDPAGLSEKSRKGSCHVDISKILRDCSEEILTRHVLPFLFPQGPVRTPALCLPPPRSNGRGKGG